MQNQPHFTHFSEINRLHRDSHVGFIRRLHVWSSTWDNIFFKRSSSRLYIHHPFPNLGAFQMYIFRQNKWIHLKRRWMEQRYSSKCMSMWQHIQFQMEVILIDCMVDISLYNRFWSTLINSSKPCINKTDSLSLFQMIYNKSYYI